MAEALDKRAVLLGMNNPLRKDPRFALFPAPVNSTGYRLYMLLKMRIPDISRLDYINGFERVNLLNSVKWSKADAWAEAEHFPSRYRGRTIVVLGEAVREALELPKVLIHPVRRYGCTWRQIPHPSGLCRWYNDPECAELAAIMLAELYEKGRATWERGSTSAHPDPRPTDKARATGRGGTE